MSVYHMCACRNQKMASDLLELEVKAVVSYRVGIANLTWVLWESSSYF